MLNLSICLPCICFWCVQLWNAMMGLLCERANLLISSLFRQGCLVTSIQHAICALIPELISVLLFVEKSKLSNLFRYGCNLGKWHCFSLCLPLVGSPLLSGESFLWSFWITEVMLAQKVCCRAATWVKSLCFAGNSSCLAPSPAIQDTCPSRFPLEEAEEVDRKTRTCLHA